VSPSLGKSGRQKGGQALSESVDEPMRQVLGAGAELKHRQDLGEGINGQPEQDAPAWRSAAGCAVRPTASCGSRRWQKKRSCRVCACEPARERKARDGRLSVALRPVRQPKRPALQPSRDPHQGDLMRGSFQTGQGGVAPGTERGVAATTSQRLDPLRLTMLAIAKKPHEGERR
jgi:hypothetical protein